MTIEETRKRLHQGQPVRTSGVPLAEAEAAMIMVHGRGGSAENILTLAHEWRDVPGIAYVAPQAAHHTWYPDRFIAPIANNEPWLSSALAVLGDVLKQVEAAGVPAERTVLLGFSQGACLALEFAARNARRFGGVAGLSGGLIGPDGTPRDYPGSLDGTPVFLGCSDRDFHIPEPRVHQSDAIMTRLGGQVTTRIYPGLGHTINRDEVAFVEGLLKGLVTV